MAMGIVGRKAGMTRIFTEDGASVPVTVIEATPNRVSCVRTLDNDGYEAIQVTVGERKASRVNKPEAGHLAKAGVEAGRGLWEFRLEGGEQDVVVQPGRLAPAPGPPGAVIAPGAETLPRPVQQTGLPGTLPGRVVGPVWPADVTSDTLARQTRGWHCQGARGVSCLRKSLPAPAGRSSSATATRPCTGCSWPGRSSSSCGPACVDGRRRDRRRPPRLQ